MESNYLQMISDPGHPRCECHDCTQARWKMSFQGQLAGGIGQAQQPQWSPETQKQMEAARQAGQQSPKGNSQ